MLTRAYSLLDHVKTIDEHERIIEGVASTPEVDRAGDVVVPDGAVFRLPMPLLWQHRADSPIGHVLAATVTKAGIKIRAQIAKDTGLPDIDRAWTLIKAGLVRGLSIGFKALTMEPLNAKDPWGGQKFLTWEWMELSAVTIAANATASIHTIKTLDLAQRATQPSYGGTVNTPSPSYVGGSQQKESRMATPIGDQITSAIAELQTKHARLEELNTRETADGSLEEHEVGERNALSGTVVSLAGKVNSLKAQEAAQAAMARTVVAKAPTGDVREAHQPQSHVVMGEAPEQKLPPGIELSKYVICRAAALRTGISALELAKHHFPGLTRIQALLKEVVPAGSTLDSTWAGPLVYPTNLVSEFIEYLRPQTIIGRIDGMTRVSFNSRIGGETSGGAGYWVGQGKAKPLTKGDYNETTIPFTKVANIAVLTDELVRFSSPSAEARVRSLLVRALQERLDIDFIDPAKTASAGVSPASITNGIANLNASGVTLDAVDVDVQALMNSFISAHIMPTHWIMPNSVALALSLMRTSLGAYAFPTINMNGGTFYGLPVVTSQYAILGTPANNLIVLLAAPEIFLADDGGFSMDLSREASLEMDDAPVMDAGSLGSPAGATGSVVVSMFQTNSVALRCERYIYWTRRRNAGVAWMDDVQWSAGTA
jgi:HK97 family phage major capsid protein/HK97 family phage prohead protease